MATTLVAVVVALVLGHVAPGFVAALRQYDWFDHWAQWLSERFPQEGFWRGRYGIVLALAPPLLLTGLLQFLLDAPLFGLFGLLYAIAVLVYAWGPGDLDADVQAILEADTSSARQEAIACLWPNGKAPISPDGPTLVEAVFHNALRRWFGVLFWFLLLGPVGAVLYRLSVRSARPGAPLPGSTRDGAGRLQAVLEWPVAQLMTLAMALVGNFDVVFTAWRGARGGELQLDAGFLTAAARASVKSELAEEAEDYAEEGMAPIMRELPELHDAMSFVWRILLLWMAMLALFVIAGWVS